MIPTTTAGMVIDRISMRSKLYGATSVSVNIAAIAAETGDAANAIPD